MSDGKKNHDKDIRFISPKNLVLEMYTMVQVVVCHKQSELSVKDTWRSG